MSEIDESVYEGDLEEDAFIESARASQSLGQMCLSVMETMREQEALSKKLAAVEKKLRLYTERLIPSVMAGMNSNLLRTPGGLQIEIVSEIVGSLPKDPERRGQAFEYVRSTGNGGLIRTEFSVEYGVETEEDVERFRELLESHKINEVAVVKQGQTINHQQMMKFLRDQTKEGVAVPLDAFGAHVRTYAKISLK